MDERYKDHLIHTAVTKIPRNNRWAVRVHVSWSEGSRGRIVPFDGPIDGLATESEAESWGIAFGKKWIDGGKPDLQQNAIFYNTEGKPVEVRRNSGHIQRDRQKGLGVVHIIFQDGREEWLKATEHEVLAALNKGSRWPAH
jgi:hypothetical protein